MSNFKSHSAKAKTPAVRMFIAKEAINPEKNELLPKSSFITIQKFLLFSALLYML